MKLFPRGLNPVAQTLRLQNPFDFRFAKSNMPKLSPGYATVSKSTAKNLSRRSSDLKVAALKRSAKGAMNSSFRNAPYSKPSTRKTTMEM